MGFHPDSALLQPASVQVCLLVGGLGTRLHAAVSDRPKALAEVAGKPFLAHLLAQIAGAGFQRAVLAVGFRGDMIRERFKDRHGPLELTYSQESSPLGTGGALRAARKLLVSDPVLVMNGDSYLEADLNAFLASHAQRRARLSMLLAKLPDATRNTAQGTTRDTARGASRYGRVDIDESSGLIRGFTEKLPATTTAATAATATPTLAPTPAPTGPGWINGGLYLCSRDLLESLPDGPLSLENQVFPSMIGKGFFGMKSDGPFIDIGTPESFAAAGAFFSGMKSNP